MHTTTDTARPGGIRTAFRRAEAWLDAPRQMGLDRRHGPGLHRLLARGPCPSGLHDLGKTMFARSCGHRRHAMTTTTPGAATPTAPASHRQPRLRQLQGRSPAPPGRRTGGVRGLPAAPAQLEGQVRVRRLHGRPRPRHRRPGCGRRPTPKPAAEGPCRRILTGPANTDAPSPIPHRAGWGFSPFAMATRRRLAERCRLARLRANPSADPDPMRHTLPLDAPVLCDGAAALPLSSGPDGAEAVYRAAGRTCAEAERHPVQAGLPPQPERALPPLLRRMFGLPVGPHPGGRLRALAHPEAHPEARRATCAATPPALGRPKTSSPSSAAILTTATPMAAWPTWTSSNSPR